MKNIIAITILFVLCGCYGRKPVKTGLEGRPMPEIKLVSPLDNSLLNTTTIASGKPTLLFAFEPWCPYCKAQTEDMIANINDLDKANIYMISTTQQPLVNDFYKHYNLSRYSNIKIGIDSSLTFRQYFGDTRIPYIALYDTDRKLQQVFIGKTSFNRIKEYVNINR